MLQESNKRFNFSASLRGHAVAERTCGRDKHSGRGKESGSAGQGLSTPRAAPFPLHGAGVPRLPPLYRGYPSLRGAALGLLAAQPQQLRLAGEFMPQEPGCSRLLPMLAAALERSRSELAQGCPCGLGWRQSSHVMLLPASLNCAATQGTLGPSL